MNHLPTTDQLLDVSNSRYPVPDCGYRCELNSLMTTGFGSSRSELPMPLDADQEGDAVGVADRPARVSGPDLGPVGACPRSLSAQRDFQGDAARSPRGRSGAKAPAHVVHRNRVIATDPEESENSHTDGRQFACCTEINSAIRRQSERANPIRSIDR
jgi:hypothetical protein